jgi:hypothetical protein
LFIPFLKSSASSEAEVQDTSAESVQDDSELRRAIASDAKDGKQCVDADIDTNYLPQIGSHEQAYDISLSVDSFGVYVGAASADVASQLKRIPGVKSARASEVVLQPGSFLECTCDEKGVVALRQLKGLSFTLEPELRKLGARRRERHLYEVVVHPKGALVGQRLDFEVMRLVLGCCPLAVRGKGCALSSVIVEVGDVLLLEGDERYARFPEWTREFIMSRRVQDSSPPRRGGVNDKARSTIVCLGLVFLVILMTLEVVSLPVGGGVFVLVIVFIRARSMEQVYESINARVLLTVAGAFGLSAALQETGLALFVASKIVNAATAYGPHGIRLAVYMLSVFLGLFMNNSACVAILGPMLGGISAQAHESGYSVSVKSLLFVAVYGAGTCLLTPLGYQTNLMVMKDGAYSFADFTRYGAPVQIVHMVCTLVFVWFFCDYLEV